jgi:hypothetical protein
MNFHSLKIEEVLEILETNFLGLSQEEIEKRLAKFGKIFYQRKRNLFGLFF